MTRPIRRMSRHDRRIWAGARTLVDLGEITAQWLEGHVQSHPNGHYGGPDPETEEIRDALIALNRAGFVTEGSQSGQTPDSADDGEGWRQRAAVYGFATAAAFDWVTRAVTEHPDLILVTHDGAPPRWFPRLRDLFGRGHDGAVPVTVWEGRVHTGFGNRLYASDVGLCFGPCSTAAYDALCTARQVTVIDSRWGRKNYLWDALAAAAGRRPS